MPNDNRVFPAGTGGNPTAPQIGTFGDLVTTAQPPIRPPPDPFVLKSVEPFTDDDNIPGFVDGQGNRIWHVDTSASAKAITFMSVGESTDFEYVVKWVKGANPVTIVAAGGANVGGTTTFAGVVFGDAYAFRSDGIEYHLVAQATNQSYVTSNSLSSALANLNFTGSQSFAALTVLGSSTFSGTAVFSTSLAVSGTASVGTLVVSGTSTFVGPATFQGTVSFSAMPTVQGVPLSGWRKIGSANAGNVAAVTFSGSWTAYTALRLDGYYLTSSGPNAEMRLSMDGGSTYCLAGNAVRMPSNLANYLLSVSGVAPADVTITLTYSGVTIVNVEMAAGGVGQGATSGLYIAGKHLSHNGELKASGSASRDFPASFITSSGIEIGIGNAATFPTMLVTLTATTGFVNQVSFCAKNRAGTTVTMSFGVIYLYGLV